MVTRGHPQGTIRTRPWDMQVLRQHLRNYPLVFLMGMAHTRPLGSKGSPSHCRVNVCFSAGRPSPSSP